MSVEGEHVEVRCMAENLVETLLDAAGTERDDGMVTFPSRAIMAEAAEAWILSHIVDEGLYEGELN